MKSNLEFVSLYTSAPHYRFSVSDHGKIISSTIRAKLVILWRKSNSNLVFMNLGNDKVESKSEILS